jgi:hypothetical protein
MNCVPQIMRAGMAFAVTGHRCRLRKKTFGRAAFAAAAAADYQSSPATPI